MSTGEEELIENVRFAMLWTSHGIGAGVPVYVAVKVQQVLGNTVFNVQAVVVVGAAFNVYSKLLIEDSEGKGRLKHLSSHTLTFD